MIDAEDDTNMRDANVDRYINNNDGYDKYENAYITSKKWERERVETTIGTLRILVTSS